MFLCTLFAAFLSEKTTCYGYKRQHSGGIRLLSSEVAHLSTNSRQKDDIEYAISDYARSMSPELYHELARGREGFLFTHTTFADDISSAVDDLEQRL